MKHRRHIMSATTWSSSAMDSR